MHKKKVELLAPVGKIENAYAAIENGADAIFFGGHCFNARTNADNFNYEQMKEVITYCKLLGIKVYITVNTLIKEGELKQVYKFLGELQNLGVDAIIIQDLGILNIVTKYFPNLKVHASTQLSAHSCEDVLFLKEQGISRVVLARELSLEEIIHIKRNIDIEIETFIHGALCYSYSGQCLLSSVIGDRSGNRGSCAQPCRMTYSLYKDNQCITSDMNLLSPKDICTLEILPDLINAGIDSFKIEGRMKSAEYVASVVGTYRKYIDNVTYQIAQNDIDNLKAIFNRGNFSTGYYNQKPSIKMMAQISPKNIGLNIGKIIKFNKTTKIATIYTKYDLNKGDGIEIWNAHKHIGIGLNKEYKKNSEFNLKLEHADIGAQVYITKKHNLIKSLKKTYEKPIRKRKINAYFYGKLGKNITLKLTCQDISVEVTGDILEQAINMPTTLAQVEEKLRKLGNTPFKIENIEVHLDENTFLSIIKINELKRAAVEKLSELITYVPDIKIRPYVSVEDAQISKNSEICVQVSNKEQFDAVLEFNQIDTIYYPFGYNLTEIIKKAKNIVIVLPHIMNSEKFDKYKSYLLELSRKHNIAFLCKTLGQVNLFSKLGANFEIDYNLNVYNSEHAQFYKNLGASKITISQEINDFKNINFPFQKVIYGYYPVMTTRQCLLNHYGNCKNKENFYLLDRKNIRWSIKTDCEACIMQILTFKPMFFKNIKNLSSIRLDFNNESAQEIKKILNELT
ncbi:hypothetical protein AN641_00180 [Candidatus Epulonipiscioides gigas]|nr:hypothetical protein AN641_00180 [Epulopiscium sp. SCG-C07WGA-EpuloA2]